MLFSSFIGTQASPSKDISCRIRPASFDDIPKLQSCNVENLPENYNIEFYQYQITKWPELAVIAENNDNEFMGYALGRLELEKYDKGSALANIFHRPCYVGHVASIAVHQQFRGNGIAQSLMKSLHESFAQTYEVDKVSLYCRVSNAAALNLYENVLQYKRDNVVSRYYEDGEDACLMTLDGLLHKKNKSVFIQRNPFARVSDLSQN
eukprot:gene15586-21052_t